MSKRAMTAYVNSKGFTLVELMIVAAVVGVLATIGVLSMRSPKDPLRQGTAQLLGFLKTTRAKAVATTSAYKVQPASSTRLTTAFSTTCDAAIVEADAKLVIELPQGVSLSDTDWVVCFNSRGQADQNLAIALQGGADRVKNVEVFLGGAVRVQP